MAADGSLIIDTKLDSKGVETGMANIGKSLKPIAGAIAGAFSVAAIIGFVKTATDTFSWLSSSYGQRIRAIEVSFMRLQGVVASIFDGLISAAAPYIIGAIQWLITMLTTLGQVIQALLQTFLGAQALTGSIDAATDAEKRLTNQTDRMGKAAKGALASFDELHVLSSQPAIPEIAAPTGGMLAQMQDFKDKLVEFMTPAIEAFDRLKEALAPLTETIWSGLKWAWDNILVPFGTWVGGSVVPAFMDLLAAGAKVLDEVLTALKPVGEWLWNNFLKPIADWTGGAILDILKWLTDRLSDLAKFIKDHPEFIEGLAKFALAVAGVWAAISVGVTVFGFIKDAITGVVGAVHSVGAILTYLASNPIGWVIAAIIAVIVIIALLIANWDAVSKAASDAWNWIVNTWNGASGWFKDLLTDIWNIVSGIVGGIIKVISGIIDFIAGIFTGDWQRVWNGVVSIFTGIWDTIGAVVKGVINIIIDLINGMLNGLTTGINVVIGALNSLQITIPDWVPGIGGQVWGMNIPLMTAPQIPRLATGAVIPPNAAFAAILGDQKSGTNIEAPEGLIRQIMQEELGKIQADINISFGGSLGELARIMKPYIAQEDVRVGSSLVQGVAQV